MKRQGYWKGVPKRKQPAGILVPAEIMSIRRLQKQLQEAGHPDFRTKEHQFNHLKEFFCQSIFCLQKDFRWNMLSRSARLQYELELKIEQFKWNQDFLIDVLTDET